MNTDCITLRGSSAPDFSFFHEQLPASFKKTSIREMYYYLLNIDEYYELLPLMLNSIEDKFAQNIEQSESQLSYSLSGLKNINHNHKDEIATYIKNIQEYQKHEFQNYLDQYDKISLSQEMLLYQLKQYAPFAIINGCLLQNIAGASICHTSVSSLLLQLYAEKIGDGSSSANHGNIYLDMMRNMSCYFPEASSWPFIENNQLQDISFEFAVFQLALSQFSRSYMPELLGATLFNYSCCTFVFGEQLETYIKKYDPNSSFLNSIAYRRDRVEVVINAISNYLSENADKANEHWHRICNGFNTCYMIHHSWMQATLRLVYTPGIRDIHKKMIALIRDKAPHALGYHEKKSLHGHSIDEWFGSKSFSPEQFVKIFATSTYVKAGDAQNSVFFKKLVAYGGPMFRIFSEEELEIIYQWINSLPNENSTEITQELHSFPNIQFNNMADSKYRQWKKNQIAESIRRYAHLSMRNLYYHMVNIEYFPDLLPFAEQYVIAWLKLAENDIKENADSVIPFKKYSHDALIKWLDKKHQQQLDAFIPFEKEPPPSREELITIYKKFAVLALIDGAWLQKTGNASICRSELSALLYRTYMDEVGNGLIHQNHPNVYRQLLKDMNVNVPELTSIDFSEWEELDENDIILAIFWLAISQFPKRFMPEILGVNLATELSGVGGRYKTQIAQLRYHNFDPYFIELHNCIDNVSTGHSAWAIKAIKIYMDQLLVMGGNNMVQHAWKRICVGYRAANRQVTIKEALAEKCKIFRV